MNPADPDESGHLAGARSQSDLARAEETAAIAALFAQPRQIPVPDPLAPSDPLFTEMVRLAGRPASEREETLEPYLAEWLERGVERLQVARYLAAAGLSFEEAAAFEAAVRARVAERMRRHARAQIYGGVALLAAGLAVAAFKLLPIWALVLACFSLAGGVSLAQGIRLLRRVTPPPEA